MQIAGRVSGCKADRRRCCGELILLGVLTFSMLLQTAAANEEEASPQERPRIGLVLGGGGAKGAAHIGVLQALEDMRVPIDCVVGTSMGALVGGSYASGTSANDLAASFRLIDWASTLGGDHLRDLMPIRTKLARSNYSNTLELGLGASGVQTPAGLIESQLVEETIRRLVANVRNVSSFEDLPTPFIAIATDMVAGEMVVLQAGDLAVAMRASMAVPGVFSPVRIGDQVLVDGGLIRNLPVDVARERCADIIIAVWVVSPQPEPDEFSSPLALISRSLDIMIVENELEQIRSLTGMDVGIPVPMNDLSAGDFLRAEEAIELGRAATEQRAAALSALALDEDDYEAWRNARSRVNESREILADVRWSGLERVNVDYLKSRLEHARPGTTIRLASVEQDMQRLFALGDFERVDYRLTGPRNGRVLEIQPVEKSTGPDFLYLDYGLTTHGDGDIRAALRAEHRRTWINRFGGEWHNTLQLGQDSLVATEFYQPLDVAQRFFVMPRVMYESRLEDLYQGSDRIARYFFSESSFRLETGVNFNSRAQLRLGAQVSRYYADRDTGQPDLPEISGERDAGLVARFIYDTRDNVGLPTDGTFASLEYVDSAPWLGSDEDYRLFEGVLTRAFDLNGNSLSLTVGGGDTLDGVLPVTKQIQLGGIRTFPGLRPGELRGRSYWFSGLSYLWQLTNLQPLFDQPLYAGLRISGGEMRDRVDGIAEGKIFGVATSISGRTPVGPFLLSLGWLDDDTVRLQFSLGRPVREGSALDLLN